MLSPPRQHTCGSSSATGVVDNRFLSAVYGSGAGLHPAAAVPPPASTAEMPMAAKLSCAAAAAAAAMGAMPRPAVMAISPAAPSEGTRGNTL